MKIGFIALKIFTLLIYSDLITFFALYMILSIDINVTLSMSVILGFINLTIFISIFFMTLLITKESKKLNSITFILSIINVFISNASMTNPLISIEF